MPESNGNGNGTTKYLKIIGLFLGIIISGLSLLWGFDIIYATDGDVKSLDSKIDNQELLMASSMKEVMQYIERKDAAQKIEIENIKKSHKADELRRRYAFNLDLMLQLEALMAKNPNDSSLKMKYDRVKDTVMRLERELKKIDD